MEMDNTSTNDKKQVILPQLYAVFCFGVDKHNGGGAETAGAPKGSELILEKASEIKPKRIEWLWPNRIPKNKLTIFSGNPDVGKTLVTVDIVARLTTGKDWPDGGRNTMLPCDVLMLIAEDAHDDTVVPRLIAAGADLERVHLVKAAMVREGDGTKKRQPSLDKDLAAIEEAITANPQIRLFTIDPVASYLGEADINKQQEVRDVLIPLRDLAERICVTGIVVGHFNKTANVNAIHKVGGSAALTEVPRAGWSFNKDPEDEEKRLMLKMKCNLAKDIGGLEYCTGEKLITIEGEQASVGVIEWGGRTDRNADDVLREEQNTRPRRIEEAKKWLKDFLVDGPRLAEECETQARAADISEATLRRAKKGLRIASSEQSGKWWWELPKDGVEPVPASKVQLSDKPPAQAQTDAHTSQMSP